MTTVSDKPVKSDFYDKTGKSIFLFLARYILPKLNIPLLMDYIREKKRNGEYNLAAKLCVFLGTYHDIHSGRKVGAKDLENFYDMRYEVLKDAERHHIQKGSRFSIISSYAIVIVVLVSSMVLMKLKASFSELCKGVTNLSKQLLITTQSPTATVTPQPTPPLQATTRGATQSYGYAPYATGFQAVQGQDVAKQHGTNPTIKP